MVRSPVNLLSFDENKLEYYIEWDDQDPTGRHIPIQHLAVNQSPYEDEIGETSSFLPLSYLFLVLFLSPLS